MRHYKDNFTVTPVPKHHATMAHFYSLGVLYEAKDRMPSVETKSVQLSMSQYQQLSHLLDLYDIWYRILHSCMLPCKHN